MMVANNWNDWRETKWILWITGKYSDVAYPEDQWSCCNEPRQRLHLLKQHIQQTGESSMSTKGEKLTRYRNFQPCSNQIRKWLRRQRYTHLRFNFHFNDLVFANVSNGICWYLLLLVENAKSLGKPFKAKQIISALIKIQIPNEFPNYLLLQQLIITVTGQIISETNLSKV